MTLDHFAHAPFDASQIVPVSSVGRAESGGELAGRVRVAAQCRPKGGSGGGGFHCHDFDHSSEASLNVPPHQQIGMPLAAHLPDKRMVYPHPASQIALSMRVVWVLRPDTSRAA